jgi:hypothetical protein
VASWINFFGPEDLLMRPLKPALLLCLLLCAVACAPRGGDTRPTQPTPQASQPPAASVASAVPKSATCALLSDADVREVQGEEPTDAQGSEHLAVGLRMSQCFYRLPTFGKSFSIEVVRADASAPTPGSVRDYWRQKFQAEAGEGREREREREEELKRENANGQVREGGYHEREREGEEEARTWRVAGLGDGAYWSGNEEGGALSVLKKDAVISVSVGGQESEGERIKKAKALVQKILKHF